MTGIDRSPTRTGSAIAVAAALVALVVAGGFSWAGLALGGVGVLAVVTGLTLARHDAVTTGGGLLLLAVIVAGLQGAPVPALLVGAVAAVVAFDSAGTAIDLGAQLGRGASTRRLEFVHTGGTVLVGTVTAGLGWAVVQLSVGSTPLTAPVLLLVAALAVAGALASRGRI